MQLIVESLAELEECVNYKPENANNYIALFFASRDPEVIRIKEKTWIKDGKLVPHRTNTGEGYA